MKKGNVTLRSPHPDSRPIPLSEKYKPYFNLGAVYFREAVPFAFVNEYRYTLTRPAISIDEVLMVAYRDIERIFGSQFCFSSKDGAAIMSRNGRTAEIVAGKKIIIHSPDNSYEINEIPSLIEGELFVPIEGLMVEGFGKKSDWQKSYLLPGDYLGLSDGDMFPSIQFLKDMLTATDKKLGIIRGAYYYERAKSLVPYRIYVPSTYTPDKKYKLFVWLHGAEPDSTVDLEPDMAGCAFERQSEAHDYIFLSVSGYSFGFYGAGAPDLNKNRIAKEEYPYLELCEYEPLSAIEEICKNYSVDCEKIFLAGNSMGGGGTVWESLNHPDIFKAIAPCGSFTTQDLSEIDFSPIRGKSLLFVCGTENVGFDNSRNQVAILNSIGVNASLCIVPGGVHDNAWVSALPEIFDFFDRQ